MQIRVVASAGMELCTPRHELSMTVAAAVVDPVPETRKNVGKPEVNPALAVGLGYMQDG